MQEIWKDIKGYEGLYKISNHGRIKCLKKLKISPSGGIGYSKEIIKRTYCNGRGYLQTVLSKDNAIKGYKVHRLVATHFIPNPNNLPQVNHKDEDKSNNHVDNLEWCTSKYNVNYGIGIDKRSRSMLNNPKITKPVLQFDMDYNLIKEWISASDCGRNGYSRVCVRDCCLGKQLTHKGYIWKFKEDVSNE